MEDGLQILGKKSQTNKRKGNFKPAGDRLKYERVMEEFDHEFVLVPDYLVTIRPFYYKR